MKLRPSPTSFIENHEVEDAIKFVENHLKAPQPRVCGPKVAIKLYTREKEDVEDLVNPETGEKTGLVRANAENYVANDKYISHVGLVVAMGLDAYHDETLFPFGARCRVGDWVTFPKHEGTRLPYKGNALKLVGDHFIDVVVEDPKDIGIEF